MPTPYPVTIIRRDGATLAINDNINYATDAPLHDLPQREARISVGYAGGGRFIDSVRSPRQFSAVITILAGKAAAPKRNALHNAARDTLIRYMPEGQEITLQTTYLGAPAPYNLTCFVLSLVWIRGTMQYEATLLALDPSLVSAAQGEATHTLPFGGQPEKTFTITAGGNVPTNPIVVITPTAPKVSRWNYRRTYVVDNPRNVPLFNHPAVITIDLAGIIAAGKMAGGATDLRVLTGGLMVDRWPEIGSGKLWVNVDIPALGSTEIEVIYGYPGADPWLNSTLGPIFSTVGSTNAQWQYIGKFMDAPGFASTYTWQWNQHVATAVGLRPINRHLPAPFVQVDAARVNAAGGEVLQATQVQGYAGTAFHHPLWLSSVELRGNIQTDPTLLKPVVRSRRDDGSLEDNWDYTSPIVSATAANSNFLITTTGAHYFVTGNTVRIAGNPQILDGLYTVASAPSATTFTLALVGNATGLGGTASRHTRSALAPFPDAAAGRVVVTFPSEREAVVVALRSTTVHNETAGAIIGADQVYLNIATPLTVSGGAEEIIYMLDFSIENETTGERVNLFGVVTRPNPAAPWNSVILDLDEQLVTMASNDFYYAFSNQPIRARWLRLLPGPNTITIRDEGVVGLSVYIEWRDRRL